MSNKETLNPGDSGYEEAYHKAPLTGKDGSINRLRSPLDAQREADKASHRAVLDAAKLNAPKADGISANKGAK